MVKHEEIALPAHAEPLIDMLIVCLDLTKFAPEVNKKSVNIWRILTARGTS